jgi:hypothetical protein
VPPQTNWIAPLMSRMPPGSTRSGPSAVSHSGSVPLMAVSGSPTSTVSEEYVAVSSQVQVLPPWGEDCAFPAGDDPISSFTSPVSKNEHASIAAPVAAWTLPPPAAAEGALRPGAAEVPATSEVPQPASRRVAAATGAATARPSRAGKREGMDVQSEEGGPGPSAIIRRRRPRRHA